MRVLIIGGGVGGLTFAHSLRKAGIEAKVFERHTLNTENLAGYGLHIDYYGRQALRSCLPLSNWTKLQSLFSSAGTQIFFRDTQLQLVMEKDDAELSTKPAREIERSGIGRLDLRDTLLEGLDDTVEWNRAFTRYENTADGDVRAYFSDGTYEDDDLLVGADGPNCPVRKQRLPDLQRLDLGVSAIAGRYVLTEKTIDKLPEYVTNGSLNNIVPTGKGWLFTSAWTSRPADSDANADPENYIVWAYVMSSSDLAEKVDTRNVDQLNELVLAGIQDWAPELRELVLGCDSSSTKCMNLKSMPILSSWVSRNVTLMGDAIHNMTPMADKGANSALRDAETLTRWLVDAVAGRISVTECVAGYERDMRLYANEALQLSMQNALGAINGGTMKRRLFRGFLRVAQACPIVMRNTFGKAVVK